MRSLSASTQQGKKQCYNFIVTVKRLYTDLCFNTAFGFQNCIFGMGLFSNHLYV